MFTYENYEKIRVKAGVTDAELCRATGVSKSSISAWKKGVSIPKAEKLQKIASFLNVTIDDLELGQTSRKSAYASKEMLEIAQKIGRSQDLRRLFYLATSMTKPHVKALTVFADLLKTEEKG